jgi:methionine synthase I (cobalamin-dependent)
MGTMIQNYAKRNKLMKKSTAGWAISNNREGQQRYAGADPARAIKGIYMYLEEGGLNMIGTNTFSSTTTAI